MSKYKAHIKSVLVLIYPLSLLPLFFITKDKLIKYLAAFLFLVWYAVNIRDVNGLDKGLDLYRYYEYYESVGRLKFDEYMILFETTLSFNKHDYLIYHVFYIFSSLGIDTKYFNLILWVILSPFYIAILDKAKLLYSSEPIYMELIAIVFVYTIVIFPSDYNGMRFYLSSVFILWSLFTALSSRNINLLGSSLLILFVSTIHYSFIIFLPIYFCVVLILYIPEKIRRSILILSLPFCFVVGIYFGDLFLSLSGGNDAISSGLAAYSDKEYLNNRFEQLSIFGTVTAYYPMFCIYTSAFAMFYFLLKKDFLSSIKFKKKLEAFSVVLICVNLLVVNMPTLNRFGMISTALFLFYASSIRSKVSSVSILLIAMYSIPVFSHKIKLLLTLVSSDFFLPLPTIIF
ncbi:EpsG family protein [Vibrio breoganii]|uniref:EpsG family protein n=1 Tax=Vibrio breoganii TaxID=553239 RepID=UPI000317251E|nr:EpsG family protein [Vibrio breoganii]OED96325.1 hypothetical protein A1QG_13570 [Vibrio breoganii ZF-29]TKG21074.1 hypothetical protein FCV81_10075 [Vibrio breoganii]